MKNRIKELREAREVTQEHLGELAGTSRQAIHAIEAGNFEESSKKSRADKSRRGSHGSPPASAKC